MNMAQALLSLGYSCYSWRQDVQVPGALGLLAMRDPSQARGAMSRWSAYGGIRHSDIRVRMVMVLRRAYRKGERLSYVQLCERIEVGRWSRHTRKALNDLCRDGVVCRSGEKHSGRGTVYWAEEEKKVA